jgi:hypothetical protein
VAAIQSGKAITVSDGTVCDGRGAASAVIRGDNIEGIYLNARVPGSAGMQVSFQSEAVGLLLIVRAASGTRKSCKHASRHLHPSQSP